MANSEMIRDFIDGHDNRVPKRDRDPRTRKTESVKRKPLKPQSLTQAKRTAFLEGVRAERLAFQLETGNGNWCEHCKRRPLNAAGLELHHVEKRSKGKGFRSRGSLGTDDPRNLLMVCRPCHDGLESSPMFGGSA